MTDRRRRTHPAPTGLPSAEALSSRPHVVVVGAGIAGLAAATGLAERGISLDVIANQCCDAGRRCLYGRRRIVQFRQPQLRTKHIYAIEQSRV